jgi:phospholipase/carboxylesterase
MNTQTLSLTHLVREPKTESANPPLLLLLHGVGSNEHDLFELTPHLDERFFVVSARAPITLMPGSYAWFHVEFAPNNRIIINPDDAEASRNLLIKYLDELVAAYQLDAKRVYLMGFSQGAIISQSIALTRPDKIAGVVAMSGRILPEVLSQQAPNEAFGRLPVMVVHGLNDQKLDISYGRNARDVWSKLPVALTYREYAMGHEVTQDSLRDIVAWLKERLDGDPPPPS